MSSLGTSFNGFTWSPPFSNGAESSAIRGDLRGGFLFRVFSSESFDPHRQSADTAATRQRNTAQEN